jgi:nucleotide-binding universal stress UspA family protein
VEDAAATARLAHEAKLELAAVARMLAERGVDAIESHVVVADHVAQAIIEFAADHDVDAIAMSTHGRGASPFAMGSVADKVLRASEVPMLLQRPVAVSAEPALVDAASMPQQLPALANM